MAAIKTAYLLLLFLPNSLASFFEIQYPNVLVTAETGGNLTVEAGPQGGNIIMKPTGNGTVYIGKTDILKLFEVVNSMPPVWELKSVHGSLGTFLGGSLISLNLEAVDPEGGSLKYEKVSGALPPGVVLNKATGQISGTAPDVDATYQFGIRVTDKHGKYADQIFSIDTREKNQCLSNPCSHGGTCKDDIDSFVCTCQSPYGGTTCATNCESRAFGVDQSSKKIADAQMSAHYSYGDHPASDGRLNAPQGWIGQNTASWLQVDLGNVMDVHAVATQGYTSSTYYTSTYQLQYSSDGNTFVNTKNGTSNMVYNGSTNVNTITKHVLTPPIHARFIRFKPVTYSSHPGLRVEVYGCEINS
ncbi:EGF-like repeat and discoidin I-like domain-containing protein 3 [Argopecten irradians]|uniref:EGF-like repeat and discoidin I-like domain-containing protein 3 n=1 Tax=Argopecten irradians TaxID=31199 RepID=UPI0037202A44